MSFNVGDTVGDYQIIGVLGAGGMGKVYKVKNAISDRIDALKVLLPNLADDAELADRFIREIKVLASLNHPNIAGLRTAFRMENQLLMVMEFVEGTNLDDRTKAGPIPLAEAVNYIMQALSALGYAHKHGVIHRDIKPANMMLTPDNVIKLMDFGIAKSKSDKKLTQTGTTMGSLFYMSAEQVQGNELDGRSDLYSVGVSLYEMVTGVRPFQGKSDFEIMVAQLQQTPMPPIQVMPGLPSALNEIIMISLEKEPGKRFQTAEAFAAALGSIVPSLNSSAAPGSVTGLLTTPPPMAPPTMAQPVAAGGTVPPTGGFINTNNMPTVMAPQPEAPAATAPPPPDPSHGLPQPGKSTGYRGLYMTLGALIVVAILVLTAIQVPRFLKTHASKDQAPPVTTTDQGGSVTVPPNTQAGGGTVPPQTDASGGAAISTPPNAGTTPPTGVSGGGNSSSPPAGSGISQGTSSSMASTENPARPGGSRVNTQKKGPRGGNSPLNLAGGEQRSPVSGGGGEGQVAPPPVPGGEGQVGQPGTALSTANTKQLEELADLQPKLEIRARTVHDGVENLRKQMASTGNNLRSDISASQTRMGMYLDKFDAAMKAGDAVAAKKNMALAEREVENLEKFLGN